MTSLAQAALYDASQDITYVLSELLGEGGQASVWRAIPTRHRQQIGVPVAVKFIKHSLNLLPPKRRKLLLLSQAEEYRISKLLNESPYFVHVFDFFHEQQRDFFVTVMELIEGHHLHDIFEAYQERQEQLAAYKAMPWPIAFSLVYQALQGLSDAKKLQDQGFISGFVHRDLKPSNLMLTKEGQLKIIDLGLAKHDQRHQLLLTEDGQIRGTFAYAAPEQLLHNAKITTQSDIFSLGVLLYEWVTSIPFGRWTQHEHIQFIHHFQPSKINFQGHNEELPSSVTMAISRLLQPKPEHRPNGPDDAKDILFTVLQQEDQQLSSPQEINAWIQSWRKDNTLPHFSPNHPKKTDANQASSRSPWAQTDDLHFLSQEDRNAIHNAAGHEERPPLPLTPLPTAPFEQEAASPHALLVPQSPKESLKSQDHQSIFDLAANRTSPLEQTTEHAIFIANQPQSPNTNPPRPPSRTPSDTVPSPRYNPPITVIPLHDPGPSPSTPNVIIDSSIYATPEKPPTTTPKEEQHLTSPPAAPPTKAAFSWGLIAVVSVLSFCGILSTLFLLYPKKPKKPTPPQRTTLTQKQAPGSPDAGSMTRVILPSSMTRVIHPKRPTPSRLSQRATAPFPAKRLPHRSLPHPRHTRPVRQRQRQRQRQRRYHRRPQPRRHLRRRARPHQPPKPRGTTQQQPAKPAPTGVILEFLGQTCTLFRKGHSYGRKHKQTLFLPPGSHQLRCINRSRNIALKLRVQITQGRLLKKRIDLRMGQLRITSHPWCSIWQETLGVLGKSGELIELPPGQHLLFVRKQGKDDQIQKLSIVIHPNRLTQRTVHWKP